MYRQSVNLVIQLLIIVSLATLGSLAGCANPRLRHADRTAEQNGQHATPTSSDVYVNPTLGIRVTKPSGWQFATAEQNAENLARVQLKDEQAAAKAIETATAPLVAMLKHPEPYDDLNPSFKIIIKPLQRLPADDPKRLIGVIAGPLSDLFNDYTVVTPPTDTTVGGLKAAYLKIHYSLKDPDGRCVQTCSELWVVPRGRFFFMIGAGTRQDEATGTRSEIRAIINSLVIEPQ